MFHSKEHKPPFLEQDVRLKVSMHFAFANPAGVQQVKQNKAYRNSKNS